MSPSLYQYIVDPTYDAEITDFGPMPQRGMLLFVAPTNCMRGAPCRCCAICACAFFVFWLFFGALIFGSNCRIRPLSSISLSLIGVIYSHNIPQIVAVTYHVMCVSLCCARVCVVLFFCPICHTSAHTPCDVLRRLLELSPRHHHHRGGGQRAHHRCVARACVHVHCAKRPTPVQMLS